MDRTKKVMRAVIVVSFVAFAIALIVQMTDWMRFNIGYERVRDRMLMAYISGGETGELQTPTAYLHATANLRISDMKETFFRGSASLLMLVSAYVPVHVFERHDRPRKRRREDVGYLDGSEGEILYDDRRPEVH